MSVHKKDKKASKKGVRINSCKIKENTMLRVEFKVAYHIFMFLPNFISLRINPSFNEKISNTISLVSKLLKSLL